MPSLTCIYNIHGDTRYLSQDQSKEREPTRKGHWCQSSALQNIQHHGWMNTSAAFESTQSH